MKKRFKKIVSLLLAVSAVMLSLSVPASAEGFTDVPNNAWYRKAVYDLVEKKIISGNTETTFDPDGKLTRAQFATMLAKSTLTSDEINQYAYKGIFKDVDQKYWGNKFINWTQEAGIVSGYEDGTFHPDRPVSREEMAIMIVNFSHATGRKMLTVNKEVTFADNDTIANYAKKAVKACQLSGVLTGYDDSTFRPKGGATRAEAASLVSRVLKKCVPAEDYQIINKRIRNAHVKAVIFDPAQHPADVILAGDKAAGKESASSMISRSGAFIGINGSYFDMTWYQSLGTIVKDGKVITTFNKFSPAKSAISMDEEGKFFIQNFAVRYNVTLHISEEEDSVLDGVILNRYPSSATDGARILFTKEWGDKLGFPARDAVTVDEKGEVTNVTHNNSNVSIPETGYVLAQRARRKYEGNFFDTVKVGDVLDIEQVVTGLTEETPKIPKLSIGAGPCIVKNGKPYGNQETYIAEGFNDASITVYTSQRMGVGIREDGKLVLISSTTTLSNLSNILVDLGCTDALNFDGGGSSNLYVDGYWLRGPKSRLLTNMLIFK